jgi:hypothetical protein
MSPEELREKVAQTMYEDNGHADWSKADDMDRVDWRMWADAAISVVVEACTGVCDDLRVDDTAECVRRIRALLPPEDET